MYDAYGYYQAGSVATASTVSQDYGLLTVSQAYSRFNSLCWRAQAKRMWSKLTGRSRRLLDLDDARDNRDIEGIYEAGCLTIEVAKIKGSECRVCDFDREFLPLSESSRQRWVNVYGARMADIPLPAISVVQIGDVYYVRDGHHRVSVARLMGEAYIEANTQVWQLRGETASAPAMTMRLVNAM